MIYEGAYQYLKTCSSELDRITKIGQVIDALIDMQIAAAENGDIEEYSLDSGQTKIRTRYRNPEELQKSLAAYIHLEQVLTVRYNKRHTGSVLQLIDRKSFQRR